MRPEELSPLFRPLSSLRGAGPAITKLLKRNIGETVFDLLTAPPVRVIDRSYRPQLGDVEAGRIATLQLKVESVISPRGKAPVRIRCSSDGHSIDLIYFRAQPKWLSENFPIHAERLVSGKVDLWNNQLQMTHPDYVVSLESHETLPLIEPVYPSSGGLAPKTRRNLIQQALANLPNLQEWIDPTLLAERKWPSWHDAITRLHTPMSAADLEPEAPHNVRLAYDEALANQLSLALVRADQSRRPGRPLKATRALIHQTLENLPFALTGAQQFALQDIWTDMAAEHRMLRLLQGDVGSGKTIVALFAMLAAIEAGAQAALLAPTDILARQHAATLKPAVESCGKRLALLTGRAKIAERREVLLGLKAAVDHPAHVNIIVGTHALLQDDVQFANLGLAVLDEQHRFGVDQRLRLTEKGKGVDILAMTATPIPRTLSMVIYGDLEVSRLDEKPPGRKPITTRILPRERYSDLVDGLHRKINAGERAFWVCPLVEDSDLIDLQNAEDRYEALRTQFGDRVALVHGRMKGPEKDAAMTRFAKGEVDILVSTTVIEVGVNIPEATLMIVEHAERFGLAQLHQLRGRIGRGSGEASCILLYGHPLGKVARARLEALRATDDGFEIAEQDLRLRGAGDVLGVRQSGLPDFRFLELPAHESLLTISRDDSLAILRQTSNLEGPRGAALISLLYLFKRDSAVRNLQS